MWPNRSFTLSQWAMTKYNFNVISFALEWLVLKSRIFIALGQKKKGCLVSLYYNSFLFFSAAYVKEAELIIHNKALFV